MAAQIRPPRRPRQTASRILVASTPQFLSRGIGDLWDTGTIKSDQTTQIAYVGKSLNSRQLCHWSVEVWDEGGTQKHSAPAHFSIGLLDRSDWRAKWIAADPEIIRRDKEAIAPTLSNPGNTPRIFP